MELKEEQLEQTVFKTRVYEGKSVDLFIKEAYEAIKNDDKKVSKIIDDLMTIIQDKAETGEDDWEAQISFLAPVLAELFKSSADFKKQRTDLINSIQKFIATEQKKKADDKIGNLSLADIWNDISKRRNDE